MKQSIRFLVKAGKVTPAALGQSLGMAGLNIGKVVADINSATKKYEGLKVPVVVSYEPGSRDYEISVSLPPTSQLLLKEAGLSKGSGGNESAGDLSFSSVVSVAKSKIDSLGGNLKRAVLQVLGTCVSMGLTVDGKNPRVVQQEVKDGKYNSELA